MMHFNFDDKVLARAVGWWGGGGRKRSEESLSDAAYEYEYDD